MTEGFTIDTATPFGAQVERRLRDESIIWLTTVRADGTPQPSPVGFLCDGADVLIYSEPGKPKIRNIERNPRVALHFNMDSQGGNVAIITGEARIDPDAPPLDEQPAYLDKYAQTIQSLGATPESVARAYSVAIRVRPTMLRGY